MSDDFGPAGRPLWGPVRRAGDDAGPPPAGIPQPAPVAGTGPEPDTGPLPLVTAVPEAPTRGGLSAGPPTLAAPGPGTAGPVPVRTGADPSAGNPYAGGPSSGDLYSTVPATTVPATAPANWSWSGGGATDHTAAVRPDPYPPPAQHTLVYGSPPPGVAIPAQRGPVPGPGYPDPPDTRVAPGGGRQNVAAIVVACVAALLIAGSGVAFVVLRDSGSAVPPAVVVPASVEPSPAPVATPDPALRSPDGLVQITGTAAAHPQANTVLDLLDRHFTAINQSDYESWAATVSARRAGDQPKDQWLQDYRSTRDGDVRVGSITGSAGGLLVGLEFTSEQDVADAPPDLPAGRICWSTSWPVTDPESGGTIGTAGRGVTSKRAC